VTAEDKLARIEGLLDGLKGEIDRARLEIENKHKGGMRVPFQGDFANVPPSGLNRIAWWERALRGVLNED
jgi:hypothetical protein